MRVELGLLSLSEIQRDSQQPVGEGSMDAGPLLAVGAVGILGLSFFLASSYFGITLDSATDFVEALLSNPQATLAGVVDSIQGLGPQGLVFHG